MQESDSSNKTNTKERILFVSHRASRCGVHEFGINIAQAISKSVRYSFEYKECNIPQEYFSSLEELKPSAVIFNYHPLTMPWLTKKILNQTGLIHIGILHEVTQENADSVNNRFFHYHIAPDPTLILKNPLVFKTGRWIPDYHNSYGTPKIPVIGSFGFGLKGKGFERILLTVQEEFEEAVVKFHIPFSQFCDDAGEQARAIADHCQSLVKKKGIKLILSHEFLNKDQLLDFLAQNTLNAFFYDEYRGRGISSVIDYALAVKRPIAITKSTMFRHMFSCQPSICIEDSNLKQIIQNGINPFLPYITEWNETNLIWDYERIMNKIFQRHQILQKQNQFNMKNELRFLLKKFLNKQPLNPWTASSKENRLRTNLSEPIKAVSYAPVVLSEKSSLNRILDNEARAQYQKAIDQLFELNPAMMTRKIPEANVQQAFVLDTAYRLAAKFTAPRILCIGSYEDTAAAGLKKLGFQMEEIDPLLNYDLSDFFHKPSTRRACYDMIICTSVLEHVEQDEIFLTQIAQLLATGGIAILTCDYNDQYKPGDRIPAVDFRFYTQNDFKNRILPKLPDCSLIDTPAWDCPHPDFTYEGCQYTFATLVFQKNKK